MTEPLDFNVNHDTRDVLRRLLWAFKERVPGPEWPPIVMEAEDSLWGWKMPR